MSGQQPLLLSALLSQRLWVSPLPAMVEPLCWLLVRLVPSQDRSGSVASESTHPSRIPPRHGCCIHSPHTATFAQRVHAVWIWHNLELHAALHCVDHKSCSGSGGNAALRYLHVCSAILTMMVTLQQGPVQQPGDGAGSAQLLVPN